MDVKTFCAPSMQAALALVRHELGPGAAVLTSRELPPRGWRSWFGAPRMIEVTASCSVHVPSRLPPDGLPLAAPRWSRRQADDLAGLDLAGLDLAALPTSAQETDTAGTSDDREPRPPARPHTGAAQPVPEATWSAVKNLPAPLFALFAELLDAEVPEDDARRLVLALGRDAEVQPPRSLPDARRRAAEVLREEIPVGGAISLAPGERKTVALVGPTGVGKTTTIAKLAANFRLREKRRVGLITVDTYRIAAVAQLRTYADIIDLPMEVVATPKEMRQAIARLSDQELILMDTAGRSPKDDAKIQELKALLSEARPHAVHLVLSATASVSNARKAVASFEPAGVTNLVLTKLDECERLGGLLPLLHACALPVSYLTDGQDVPDDLGAADRDWLANAILAGDRLGRQRVRWVP